MKKLGIILGIIIICSLTSKESRAERAYVSDTFKITLRSGPSLENKVFSNLTSGQMMEVLDEQGDWKRVRIPGEGGDSKEGWVLSRYLITRVPWEMQATYLKQKNTTLEEKLSESRKKLNDALQEKQRLSENLKKTEGSLQGLEKDHAELKRGAKGFLTLKANYDSTRASLQSMRKELQKISQENQNLRSSQINRWFATGALVLLCGLMIGLMVGRQQKKRQRSLYE